MHDPLTSIRRLYPDGPDAAENGAPLAPDAAREAAHLAPLRDALAARPRSRPDVAALDAVVAAAVAAHPASADVGVAAVRALYGEDAGPLTREAEHEAARLAPLRDALAALPRQRPAPVVLDAVVTAAMAATPAAAGAAVVRALYGEEPAPLTPAAEREVAALAPVRDALAARPRQRPDAAALDAVVAAAATAPTAAAPTAAAPRRAPDRPTTRARARRGASWVGGLLALLVVGAVALWVGQGTGPADAPLVADASEVAAPAPADAPPADAAPEPAPAPAADPFVDAPLASAPVASGAPPAANPAASPASLPSPAAAPSASAPSAPTAAAPAARVAAATPPAAPARAARPAPAPPNAFNARTAGIPTLTLAAGTAPPPRARTAGIPAGTPAPAEPDAEALRLMYLRLAALEAAGTGWDEPPVVLGATPDPARAPTRGWVQVRDNR